VAVEDRLTGHRPGVNPDVETGNPWVAAQQTPSTVVQQTLNGVPFRLSQVKVVGDVAARDCEQVAIRHGKPVLDQDCQRVLGNRRPAGRITERAPLLPRGVGLANAPEVGIVPGALVRVALPAERLQVSGSSAPPCFRGTM